MDGVLVIDKHKGPTSHDIVQMVKKLTGARRVGHLGTLDPAATGVLPLVLNGATKLADSLSGTEKIYEFRLRLGIVTDTDDDTGVKIRTGRVTSDLLDKLRGLLPRFTGRVWQRPPIYSAIKKGGRRAYKLARRGHEVQLKPRLVTIDNLKIIGGALPNILMRLECRSGAYVRGLARDLGEALGCGACAGSIRRLRSGVYTIDDAMTIDELLYNPESWKERLVPVDVPGS